jgi:predicted peptidase
MIFYNIFVLKLLAMQKAVVLFNLAIFFTMISLNGQAQITAQHFSLKVKKEIDLGYLLYTPDGYVKDDGRQYPLLLFLHGSGERGSDLDLVKLHGPLKVADSLGLPFIILAPQCPDIPFWNVEDVKLLLDEIVDKYPVDKNRIYASGLSMGGFATWEMLVYYPDVFAAAIPVCGGGHPFRAHTFAHVPVWAFHGAKDDVVPVEYSKFMETALLEQGADVKLTIYPDAGHDAWTKTYDNPEIYKWLLKHTLNGE